MSPARRCLQGRHDTIVFQHCDSGQDREQGCSGLPTVQSRTREERPDTREGMSSALDKDVRSREAPVTPGGTDPVE